MKQKQKPLSFSLHPDNIAYIEAAVLKKKETNHRYSRSMYLDDLITHLRTKAKPRPTTANNATVAQGGAGKTKPVKRFVPPEVLTVQTYMLEKGVHVSKDSREEAEKFCDHFISNGWKVGGKTKMVSWKAAVRNWLKGNGNGQINGNNARSGQKESSHERIKRENDIKYRGLDECGLDMGGADGDMGRTVRKGERGETVERLDRSTFVNY